MWMQNTLKFTLDITQGIFSAGVLQAEVQWNGTQWTKNTKLQILSSQSVTEEAASAFNHVPHYGARVYLVT